jgi:RNA polymerase sigma-70 factor (ECF subfamily)
MSDDQIDFVNELFLKMNTKLYNISFKILMNKFDAEEAVAQTFLKIIHNVEKISSLPCPQVEAYCVVILKNESMNIIRKQKKLLQVEDLDYFNQEDNESIIEQELIETLNKEFLISCINRLSEDERYFVHLRFVNEMKFKDISKLLGVSEEAAKKKRQRILKKLQQYCKEGDLNASDS